MWVPCAPTPMLWVEATVFAAWTLFWSVIEPVWKQDVKLVTGKSWLKNLKQYAYEAEESPYSFFDDSLIMLFEVAEWADAAVFWVWIASIGIDGLMNTCTLAYQLAGCDPLSASCTIVGKSPFGGWSFEQYGKWADGPAWIEQYPVHGAPMSSTLIMPANASGSIAASLTVRSIGGGFATCTTRVVDPDSGEIIGTGSPQPGADNDAQASMSWFPVQSHPDRSRRLALEVMVSTDSTGIVAVPRDGSIVLVWSTGGQYQ